MYRIFRLDPDRFDPSTHSAIPRIHPDDVEHSGAAVRETIEKGTPYQYEFRIVLDDGEIRSLWTIGRAELGSDGRPSRVYGIVQDITERKRAEAAHRLSEARFRSVFQNAAIGKAIADTSLRFVQVNHAFCEMLGYTEQEMLALGPAELTPPEDFQQSAALINSLLAGEKSSGRIVKRYIKKDGGLVWGDLTFTLMRDAEGKPSYFFAEVIDVTERRQNERLLREREANLAEAQRIAHVGSWEWDLASGKVAWSDELYRILGVEPVENAASYDVALTRLHPEDRARTAEVMERAIRDGTPFEIENRVLKEDGTVQTLWTSGRADLDDSGTPVRLYGATQDITERRLADQALSASEERFRNLYTQAPVMMTVIGPDGRFKEVSNYWLARLGYERDEVIGREGPEFLSPESRVRLLEAYEKSVAAGERVVRNTPLVGIRKDGTTINVLATSLLEFDEQKQFQGVITVGMDVTDLRRAEEAIRESEARYRALVEHAPEAIAVLDVETGKFIDMNSEVERMFGYGRDRILGGSPIDFAREFQPDGRPSAEVAAQEIGRVLAGGTASFEWASVHASGRDMMLQVRLSRIPFKDRQLIRSSIEDITELKMLQEKARHDDKMAAIGVLAAGVAHEIGNPLLALSMAAQSLERKLADEYAQKKLGLIREHIERISKIVRQMSDLARPRVSQRSDCDLNHVVERTLEIVRYDKRAKAVAIGFEPATELPWVMAVEDQLLQVCLNLGLNALDAVAANPPERMRSLTITTRSTSRGGRTFVRTGFVDSGPGIPELARPRVFEPFFTTKGPGQGTGLGLSVSRRIIEEHEGTLGFECGDAGGTEFYFELPVKERS